MKKTTSKGQPLTNLLYQSIQYQIKQRNKLEKNKANIRIVKSLNVSILLNLCCMIEGLLEDGLKSEISRLIIRYQNKNKEITLPSLVGPIGNRIKDKLLKDIGSAPWSGIQEFYTLIIGESMKDTIGDELWKSITIQMQCRNMIAHGKRVTYSETSEGEEITESRYEGKYQNIYNYIVEKKLVSNTPFGDLTLLFNSNVINHFAKNSIQLIEIVAEKFTTRFIAADFISFKQLLAKLINFDK